jgi:hypothetical protein
MTQPSAPEVTCASCGNPASGRFCSSCGASLEPSVCAGCGEPLSPGARFCHNCGRAHSVVAADTGVKPATPTTSSSSLPWIVAAIALITLLAFLAGNGYNRRRGSSLDAPQNALPQADLGEIAPPGPQQGSGVRAPDISQLSPQERADRLFNRVMVLNSEGKADSVLFFAPMAIEAYRMLSPMNADQRYDLGRIAEVAGALPLARAQADSILSENPNHLLGLILAARIAQLDKRDADQKALAARLIAAYPKESARKLPEYERHADDITNGLAVARR